MNFIYIDLLKKACSHYMKISNRSCPFSYKNIIQIDDFATMFNNNKDISYESKCLITFKNENKAKKLLLDKFIPRTSFGLIKLLN